MFLSGLVAVVLFAVTRAIVKLPVSVEIAASVLAVIWIAIVYRKVMKLEPPSLNTYKREKVKI